MNHLTLLAAFKLCVWHMGGKVGSLKCELSRDHVTCLARDLFHSPPDPLCPTSPGAWNLEAESPWLESAERKSSPAWAQTCLVTASLFVEWDQLIVAQRAFKALWWGWWSFYKCTPCVKALDFESQVHWEQFELADRLSGALYLVKLQWKRTDFIATTHYLDPATLLPEGFCMCCSLCLGTLPSWMPAWLAPVFHLVISLQITSIVTFQLLSFSLPCFVLLHNTWFYFTYWFD